MYKIELTNTSEKQLKKLYKSSRTDYNNIIKFISLLNNTNEPRQNGKALQGNLKGLWRYRVGDFRIVAEIIDDKVIILVLNIGHRKEIYK